MGTVETSFWQAAFLALAVLCAQFAGAYALHSFDSIFAFGDSLTDTGNALIYLRNSSVDSAVLHLPYGETFFHRPTGRFSDGRLVVDFLASRLGAPTFLLPYLGLDKGQSNGKGQSLINFAVAGATAQNAEYLNATYNITGYIPLSTGNQLQWFSKLSISKNKEILSKALIYFGEIGVNDYNLALLRSISIDKIIIEFVPNVFKVIQNALEFLIQSGIKYLVIEGGYPIGCTSTYRKDLFINARRDKYGCVEELQGLREIHNKLLKQLIQNLTTKYNHDVNIIFFDQSQAYIEILKHPSHYGFTNTTYSCFIGSQTTNKTFLELCSDPSTYTNWDGIHLTEATHNVLLNLFYTKGFVTPFPNFLTLKSPP